MESRPLLLEPPCFLVAMDRVATLLAKDVKAVDGDIVKRLDNRSNDMLEKSGNAYRDGSVDRAWV